MSLRPISNNVGLTFSSLIAKTDLSIIRENITGDIAVIDQKIQKTHALGGNKIIHDLVSNYVVSNMSKVDAQTLVFSELVRVYIEDKGFEDTRIELGEPSRLHISWVNGMDEDERKQRKAYIAQHTVKKQTTGKY